MRKLSYIFLGALIGVALTIGGGAFAASTGLVGKKIVSEVPIIFNGQQIAAQGSVADGTTLLPVRSMSELFGATTEYKDGKVYLTKEGDSGVIDTPTPSDSAGGQDQSGSQTQQLTAEEIQKQLDDINKSIENNNDIVEFSQKQIDALKEQGQEDSIPAFQNALDVSKSALEKLQQQKADLEAQLRAMQDQ